MTRRQEIMRRNAQVLPHFFMLLQRCAVQFRLDDLVLRIVRRTMMPGLMAVSVMPVLGGW